MKIKAEDLSHLRESKAGSRIVFADGTFDLFHLGHVESFKNLGQYGDVVVVGVLSDEWVKTKKGDKRPVLSEEERIELVDSIRYVDYTVLAKDAETGRRIRISQILKQLRPDVFITIGESWKEREKEINRLRIQLKVIPRTHESSTTRLIERIRQTFTLDRFIVTPFNDRSMRLINKTTPCGVVG